MRKQTYIILIIIVNIVLSGCKRNNVAIDNYQQEQVQEQMLDSLWDEVTEEIKDGIIESVYENTIVIPNDYLLVQKPTKSIELFDDNNNKRRLTFSIEGLAIINDGYSDLQFVLNEYNRINYSDMIKRYNDSVVFFSEMTIDGELYDAEWYDNKKIVITRSDNKIFSFYDISQSYLGGKNISETIACYNFYSQTGNSVELVELVDDYDKLYQYVIDFFENEYKERELLPKDYTDSIYKCFYAQQLDEYGISYKLNWYADQTGVHLLFDPYILGTMSKEYIEIVIGRDDGILIKDEYVLENDISVCKIESSDIIFETLDDIKNIYEIKMNGDVVYYCEFNDVINVYEYRDNQLTMIQSINGSFYSDINNPEYIYISTDEEIMGYRNICRLYKINQDAKLVRNDNNVLICDYSFDSLFEKGFSRDANRYLKMKKDFIFEDEIIMSGTKMFPIEIIDEKYILLESTNKKRVKMSCERRKDKSVGYRIENINDEELFEGIDYSEE